MTMAAVRTEDQVFRIQMGTHAHRDRLFSHVQVNKSWKSAVTVKFLNLELKQSQFEHFLVIGKK